MELFRRTSLSTGRAPTPRDLPPKVGAKSLTRTMRRVTGNQTLLGNLADVINGSIRAKVQLAHLPARVVARSSALTQIPAGGQIQQRDVSPVNCGILFEIWGLSIVDWFAAKLTMEVAPVDIRLIPTPSAGIQIGRRPKSFGDAMIIFANIRIAMWLRILSTGSAAGYVRP